MRLQLALNVKDIDEAVDYYTKLFGTAPHKRRPGYANFAIDQPPLKLVLFENPGAEDRLNHLGIEVFDPDQLGRAITRLKREGVADELQIAETCCHATQDKIWSTEPDGLRWEWYRIVDDDPGKAPRAEETLCCATDAPA